jgi:hypothetical protein
MRINRILKSIAILTLLPILALSLSSSSGKNGGGKKEPCFDCGNVPTVTTTKEAELVLYSPLPTPPNRQSNYAVPQSPSVWSGGTSATSLYDNPSSNFYCLITVVNTSGYMKTYTWNSANKNNTMKIQVPIEGQFQVRVEYYEKCGPFWTDGTYGRGKWYSEVTTGYIGIISVTQWIFLLKENC